MSNAQFYYNNTNSSLDINSNNIDLNYLDYYISLINNNQYNPNIESHDSNTPIYNNNNANAIINANANINTNYCYFNQNAYELNQPNLIIRLMILI